jgi:hypothetical protein
MTEPPRVEQRPMGRSTTARRLQIEPVEARRLPSAVIPVLTSHTVDFITAGVEHVAARLVRTHDTRGAASSLESLAARIPFGRRQLAAAWVSDLALFDPSVPGSGRTTAQVLLRTLRHDVAYGIAEGEFRVTGKDATALSSPGLKAPQVSLDSVRIANSTNLTLAITVSLNNTGRSIPMTIPSGAPPALFDFGTATNNLMTINVRNANGTNPQPFQTRLDQRIGGYNGALFTVSTLGGFFTVSG